eukprot:15288034-Alexandrium_andersonii.AAC.1
MQISPACGHLVSTRTRAPPRTPALPPCAAAQRQQRSTDSTLLRRPARALGVGGCSVQYPDLRLQQAHLDAAAVAARV